MLADINRQLRTVEQVLQAGRVGLQQTSNGSLRSSTLAQSSRNACNRFKRSMNGSGSTIQYSERLEG